MSASLPWESDGLDKSRFEAYAKLLLLKNGRQVEEASDFNEMICQQTKVADLDDADSVNVNVLSRFDDDKLKKAFLDRLSELVANEKGAHHVSSSLMIEWPDRVDIFVAKNTGIRDKDPSAQMLETIASSLREISRLDRQDAVAIDIKQRLWTSLVQSYKSRIGDFIIEARQALKKTSPRDPAQVALTLDDGEAYLFSPLGEFQAMVNDASRSLTQGGLEEAVRRAHDICHLYNEQEFEEITDNSSHASSLRNALGFLGRLRTCFNTLIRAAERLSNFQSLRILPAAVLPTGGAGSNKKNLASNNWSVAKIFSSLGLPLDDRTVESLFSTGKRRENWNKSKLLQRFDKLKSPTSQVHAEVQVILAATRHNCTGASVLKYLGCSKRSCFLCSRFIQRYGGFATRGCHGKLYDLWTLPQASWLAEGERLRLVRSLKHVEKDMRNLIRNGKIKEIAHARESTVGGSSLATVKQQVDNSHTMRLVSRHLEAQRAEIAVGTNSKQEMFKDPSDNLPAEGGNDAGLIDRLFEHDQTQHPPPSTRSATILEQNECQGCGRETRRHCSHCNRDRFCCQACQDQMSLHHLALCSARPVTTADILFADAIEDELPKDEQTREDFGFTRCRHKREETCLFAVYKHLLVYIQDPETSAVKLNEWQRKGMLTSKIIEKFSTIPEKSRGGDYPWFLRNQHILDPSTPPLQFDGQDNLLLRAINAARPYLEPEDRDKDILKLEPWEKRHCFVFFALALDSSHPNPNSVELDLWYDFGFAVCTNEHHERSLGGLYGKLVGGNKFERDCCKALGIESSRSASDLAGCPFGKFWRGWKNGTLANLFDEHGLGQDVDGNPGVRFNHLIGVPYLRDFLCFPTDKDGLRPSVWRLKHLLALEDNTPLTGFPAIAAAAREYGFTPQLDARTKLALREFYRRLLNESNPLDVHDAKHWGTLLEYAQARFTDIGDGVREVLRNIDSARARAIGATSSP